MTGVSPEAAALPALIRAKTSKAFATARVYALEVMVEAVMASTSPPSLLTESFLTIGSKPFH